MREGGSARAGAVSHRPQPEPIELALAEVAGRNVPIEPPTDLPPDAQELWREIAKALAEVGIIDRIDLPMLRLFCIQHARAWMAHRALDEPISEEELPALDQRIREMDTINGALKVRIAQSLRAGLVPDVKDINASANYERELTNLRLFRDARARFGNLVALGSTGQLVEHPLIQTEARAGALALRFASSFGVTPQARAQLGLLIVDAAKGKRVLDEVIGRKPPKDKPSK